MQNPSSTCLGPNSANISIKHTTPMDRASFSDMADNAMNAFTTARRRLEGSVDLTGEEWYIAMLAKAEDATGIPRFYIFSAIMITAFSYMACGYGISFIFTTLSIGYPLYHSTLALEGQDMPTCRRWLIFWVVYGCFRFFETTADNIISWLPLYSLFKLLFLLWCYLPIEHNGSDFVYTHFIRPNYLKNANTLQRLDGILSTSLNKFGNIPELRAQRF